MRWMGRASTTGKVVRSVSWRESDSSRRALQRVEPQNAPQTTGDGDIVGARRGFKLVEEPEALLRERERCLGDAQLRNDGASVRSHRGRFRTRCAATSSPRNAPAFLRHRTESVSRADPIRSRRAENAISP